MQKKTIMPQSKEFLVGFASSMFQTSANNCGDSNWSMAIRNGTIPDATPLISHWENFDTDLDLMKSTGINSYRFSIEWSHVEPTQGVFNRLVIDRYQTMVEACLQRNITPMITLYHFTEPAWFTALGGFENEENIVHFTEYCTRIFPFFSSRVKLWCTINEPAVQAFMSYFLGQFPPHQHNLHKTIMTLKHLLQAHIAVYYALKALPQGDSAEIGIVHNVLRFKPLYPLDPVACCICPGITSITDDLVIQFFKTGLFDYSITLGAKIHYSDKSAVQANDFIGLNFYANPVVGPNMTNVYGATHRAGQEMGDMFLSLDPDGFADALDEVAGLNKPIYITETGIADHTDVLRQKFLTQYFDVIKHKVSGGVDIRGCYLWTAWDNFEWNQGYSKNFGFFSTDRKPRPSAEMLGVCFKDMLDHCNLLENKTTASYDSHGQKP